MNNYPYYKNNFFMNKMPKAEKSYEQYDVQKNALYDPYQGFIRGNLFKNLYDPYKIKQPYEIKPMNEQAELLTAIDALCFSSIDLDLYLDIFPDDRNIINLYNQYNEQKRNLVKQYESKFGPLTLDSESLNNYPWAWDDRPWPWENK